MKQKSSSQIISPKLEKYYCENVTIKRHVLQIGKNT